MPRSLKYLAVIVSAALRFPENLFVVTEKKECAELSFRSHHHILAICGIANLLAPRHYSGRLCWAHSEAAGVTVFVPFKLVTRTIAFF